jgi:hypothetical protein
VRERESPLCERRRAPVRVRNDEELTPETGPIPPMSADAGGATNDSARDVRAADLQEETVRPIGICRAPRQGWFTGPTKTAAPKRTSQRAERAIRQRARTRAQPQTTQSQTNGEAPVKYELTGASCHLRTEARGVA